MQEVMPFAVMTQERSYNNFVTVYSIQHIDALESYRRCLSHQLNNSLLDQTNMKQVSRFVLEENVLQKYTRPYLDLDLPEQKSKRRQPIKILSIQKIKEGNSVSKSKQNICERGKKKGPGISISRHSKENTEEKLKKIELGGCLVENCKPKQKHKRILLSKDFLQF